VCQSILKELSVTVSCLMALRNLQIIVQVGNRLTRRGKRGEAKCLRGASILSHGYYKKFNNHLSYMECLKIKETR
jgi:hypothetical protein